MVYPGSPFSILETVAIDTPAILATSLIVGLILTFIPSVVSLRKRLRIVTEENDLVKEYFTHVAGSILGSPSHISLQNHVATAVVERARTPETHCYLCGNCDMIYESLGILKGHVVPPERLFAEVYF